MIDQTVTYGADEPTPPSMDNRGSILKLLHEGACVFTDETATTDQCAAMLLR